MNNTEEFIIKTLNVVRFASVKYLSDITYTSPSSIRRDLTRLENAGIVKRSYGGVSLVDEEEIVPPIFMRKDKNRSQKRAIARNASSLIKDGMTISFSKKGFIKGNLNDLLLNLNNIKKIRQ